jgi:lipoprotein-releasing system permease protein
MRYAAKLAVRHLLSTPGQTALLMLGVAIGVSVFVFMSALIGGLATLLTQRTVGNIPHVVIEMAERDPKQVAQGERAQVVMQKDLSRRAQIAVWEPAVRQAETTPGVLGVSPQIRGSAFVRRGEAIAPVGVIGVQPDKLSAIADIASVIVDGSEAITPDSVLIGATLAGDLGLRTGQMIQVRSDRGRERSFRIGGIFALGISSADRQAVYMNFSTARALFDLPNGISRIEIKVEPPEAAPAIAERLQRATGLDATAWTDDNAQLFEALDAQARTGTIIKAFALVTIVIGIASAMLLSIVRRRAEIGIMRAVGASRGFVLGIFVIEGTLIGTLGAVSGAAIAWLALTPFPPIAEVQSGGLPIDRAQGDYLVAVVLTSVAAALASVLAARGATRIDPVEAIGT